MEWHSFRGEADVIPYSGLTLLEYGRARDDDIYGL